MPAGGALEGRHLVLGVTGGIAAYKSASLARELIRAGATVDVVLTAGATNFVGAATFAGITGRPVHTDLWEELDVEDRRAPHIRTARDADAIVVAPATAHLIARYANGLADDLLTNTLLMATSPVVVAPAMHTEMWEHPATRTNIALLRERGVHLVGPAEGELAGGDTGEGRMEEPEVIAAAVADVLTTTQDLAGRRIVITAGPTREHLDPVRFLGNRSSGRMGFAIAAEAAGRGAQVDLVAGPVELATPAGVHRHDVVSAHDMHDAVTGLAGDADVVIKAAAVADFRPSSSSERKIKKDQGPPTVELIRNPDILAELGANRTGERPVLVGFAAETEDVEEHGRAKLDRKGADLIVVNDVSRGDAGFEVETNQVLVLGRDGTRVEIPLTTKREIAGRILDQVAKLLG